jgi:hypothetical protein
MPNFVWVTQLATLAMQLFTSVGIEEHSIGIVKLLTRRKFILEIVINHSEDQYTSVYT